MSQFFDQASLVMVPSGYKNGKVYSQKPLSTDGELTFTRASNATRVNSSGLVEKVRENLTLYSEDYTNAYWYKLNVNISANSIANPLDGAITATTVTPNTTVGNHVIYTTPFAMSANTEVSQSIYAKANGYNYVMVEGYDGSNNPKIMFNLSDGSFYTINASGNPVGSVEVLANGWYRLKMTWKTQAGSPNVYTYYFVYDTTPATNYAGDGTSGAYFFGPQLEYGTTTDYIGPTAGTSVSVGPVSGLPRLDYSGGASCPSLLLEPQRTNLVTYSEQFDNAAWVTGFGTASPNGVTANYGISPDGYQNADRIQLTVDGSSTVTQMYQTPSASAGTYTISVWLKSLSGTPTISILDAYNAGAYEYVTLTSEWVRYTHTFVAGGGGIVIPQFLLVNGITSSSADFLAYGYQLEAGAYATSYIPTLSTAVTRVADAASKTGISSLIGQTEGTLFVDFVWTGATSSYGYVSIENAATSYRVRMLYIQSSNTFNFDYILNNSSLGYIYTFSPVIGQRYRIAWAYKSGDSAIYINGIQSALDTDAINYTDLSSLNFYNPSAPEQVMGGKHNQALLFKTRLSNADLATLTTI